MRNMLQLFVVTLFLSAAFAYEYADRIESEAELSAALDNINNVANEERIIKGSSAVEGAYPFAVALTYYKTYVCSASIISPTTVLTAAHCLFIGGEEQPASMFIGTIGSVNRSSSEATNITFSRSFIHPKFNDTNLRNDIAVLKTTVPIVMDKRIQKVCIASKWTTTSCKYKNAVIMGWGTTDKDDYVYPDTLQYARVLIKNHLACIARYPRDVTNDMICVDGFGKGFCNGDSGGPMIHNSPQTLNRPVQIGLASFVRDKNGCGSLLLSPGVETRLSSYETWIREVTDDTEICSF